MTEALRGARAAPACKAAATEPGSGPAGRAIMTGGACVAPPHTAGPPQDGGGSGGRDGPEAHPRRTARGGMRGPAQRGRSPAKPAHVAQATTRAGAASDRLDTPAGATTVQSTVVKRAAPRPWKGGSEPAGQRAASVVRAECEQHPSSLRRVCAQRAVRASECTPSKAAGRNGKAEPARRGVCEVSRVNEHYRRRPAGRTQPGRTRGGVSRLPHGARTRRPTVRPPHVHAMSCSGATAPLA